MPACSILIRHLSLLPTSLPVQAWKRMTDTLQDYCGTSKSLISLFNLSIVRTAGTNVSVNCIFRRFYNININDNGKYLLASLSGQFSLFNQYIYTKESYCNLKAKQLFSPTFLSTDPIHFKTVTHSEYPDDCCISYRLGRLAVCYPLSRDFSELIHTIH